MNCRVTAASFLMCGAILAALPAPLYAATKKPNTLMVQASTVIADLLASARPAVLSRYNRIQALDKENATVRNIGTGLNDQKRLADQTHTQNSSNLVAALENKFATDVTALLVPQTAAMHRTLRNQVQVFRGQVLDSNNANFISGETYQHRRPAMSRVVSSENDYVKNLKSLVKSVDDYTGQLSGEMLSLSNNLNQVQTRFGFAHYINLTLQKFEAYKAALDRSATFYNGTRSNRSSGTPYRPCQGDSASFTTFQFELADMVQATQLYPYRSDDPLAVTWPKFVTDKYVKATYNGIPGGFPGWISAWNACITSKRNNISTLQSDIEREYRRNNIESARQLDLQRADLEYQMIIVTMERDVVSHRRDQVNNVLGSVGQQADILNLGSYPDAWRKTMAAHAVDLTTVAEMYPDILKSTIDLLAQAQTEVSALGPLTDPEQIRSQLILVRKKIEAIRASGIQRLMEQLDSANENLGTMSVGIASGELSLDEALNTYQRATETKVTFWESEVQAVPARLIAAQSEVQKRQGAFDQSLALNQDVARRLADFTRLSGDYSARVSKVNQSVATARFNPVYSSLLSQWLSRIPAKGVLVPIKAGLAKAIVDQLRVFNGIDTTVKPGKKVKAAKVSAQLAPLVKAKQQILASIDTALDIATFPLLGEPISSFLAQTEDELNQIKALQK